MTIKIRSTRRHLVALLAGCLLSVGAFAAPVAAAPGENGSCVATFVVPQAHGSGQADATFGDTVRVLTVAFYPLGQTVSFQAGSERDACPFQAPG